MAGKTLGLYWTPCTVGIRRVSYPWKPGVSVVMSVGPSPEPGSPTKVRPGRCTLMAGAPQGWGGRLGQAAQCVSLRGGRGTGLCIS